MANELDTGYSTGRKEPTTKASGKITKETERVD